MSEEQLEEKMKIEENKVLIIMGIVFGAIWVILLVIDLTGTVISGFIYFLYGLLNIGAFLLYMKSQAKKNQDKWVRTSLFEENQEDNGNETSE